jgi:hypothetical protein
MGEGNENLVYPSPPDFKSFLHVVKPYVIEPPALLPIREEPVLRIFIALKNQSPWLGLNPQPLGSVASTLTTTPPRRQVIVVPVIISSTGVVAKNINKHLKLKLSRYTPRMRLRGEGV